MPHAPRALTLLTGSLKSRARRNTNESPQPTPDLFQTPSAKRAGAMPPSKLSQYARGSGPPASSEPMTLTHHASGHSFHGHATQPFEHTSQPTSYYPPSSNPNPRQFNTSDVTKLPLAKSSLPSRSVGRPRNDSNSSLPPLGSPPASALPLPPGASPRRRANSEETAHPPVSLPSNLGTPFNSPPRTHETLETHHHHGGGPPVKIRAPPRNFASTQQASQDLRPFVLSHDGTMDMIPGQQTTNLARHHSNRGGHLPEPPVPTRRYPSELGFMPSPDAKDTKLATQDASLRRSYVGQSPTKDMHMEGRASSPTLDRRLVGQPRPTRERSREPTMFQEDEDDEDLNSNYPLENEGEGTPRASYRLGRRTDGFLESSPRAPARRVGQSDFEPLGQTKKRRRESLDYDDVALERMSYAELQGQPFDMDPTRTTLDTNGGPAANESLSAKLERSKAKGEKEQKQFFTQMSLADWDRSGDWFMEQFGIITQRLKETRANKRVMVEKFEAEISSREEAVRARKETINRKLDKIKHKGEDMLADREI